MSMRVLLVAALAAAGACAHVPPGKADAPLAARLNVTASGMDVGLSDKAHVAVFAVTPGQGVSLVYPATHERSTFVAGWSTLNYDGSRGVGYPSPTARFASSTASTVLVLVASREPLDVRRFAAGVSLERAMGYEVYRARDADKVIGGIARLTVAGMDEGDWAMDVTAVPMARTGTGYAMLDEGRFPFEQPYAMVSCGGPDGGGFVLVHVEFAAYACPLADPVETDSSATDEGDGGLSASRAAITRRTFAPAEAGAAESLRTGGEQTRIRATGAEGQADRRVRAPRENGAADRADGSARGHSGHVRGAADRGASGHGTASDRGGPDRGSGERIRADGSGGERASGGSGGRGARHP